MCGWFLFLFIRDAGLGSLAYVNFKEFDFGIKCSGFNSKKPCCLCLITSGFRQRHLDQVSLEPLHFIIEVDSAEYIQRFEPGCFVGESLIACQCFGFCQKCVSQIDNALNTISIGSLGKFQTHSSFRQLAGYTAMSHVLGFHQSCLIDVHQYSPFGTGPLNTKTPSSENPWQKFSKEKTIHRLRLAPCNLWMVFVGADERT